MRLGATHPEDLFSGKNSLKPFRLIGLKILLVDDSVEILEMLHRKLSRYGAELEIAFNGEEALKLAPIDEYDAVLMDVNMPCLDGPSTVESLRRSGFDKPIIALTSEKNFETQRRCREAGYSAFLTKDSPIDDIVATVAATSFHQVF